MSKFFVRITILTVALYMLVCHIAAVAWQTDLWSHTYTVLFEICVCMCISAQGKYHCKYMRWTAYGITLNDAVVSADEVFDFLPYHTSILLPFVLISLGIFTTTALASIHYIKVRKLKKRVRTFKKTISEVHP